MGPRIGIITAPVDQAAKTPLSNLVAVVDNGTTPTHIVSGNAALGFFDDSPRTPVTGIQYRAGGHPLTKIVRFAAMQARIALVMLPLTGSVDTWVFFIGGESLVTPMIIARLTGRTTLLALPGSDERSLDFANDQFSKVLRILSAVSRRLTSRVVVYSWRLVSEWDLGAYQSKVSVAHHHFIDFARFRETRRLKERENLVGYIGRLSQEKGILQFVRAMPLAIKQDSTLEFVVVGDGPLVGPVREYVDTSGLGKRVRVTGWIEHTALPDLLNELRLLVIPSYTEGLPNVMLEAMACGTPVLATAVGGIPDVITEGETGFLMKDNSAESIAGNIPRVLESIELERVAEKARQYVQREFTFERARDSWSRIIRGMKHDGA